ncbi:MAG TPA: response regulator [bacterium]|nr:response regulator [bacterium]
MTSQNLILIVEDQPGFRRIYEDVLSDAGYEVVVAEDGEKGWQMIRDRKPNLVLLDLGLPKMDGFEVLKRIREDEATRSIPIIIFSVMGDEKDIKKAMDMGANDYTIKGFYTPRQILSKVKNLVQTSEVGPSETSFKLMVDPSGADAVKVGQILSLGKDNQCPACAVSVRLEVFPDAAPGGEHWFRARWSCPQCGKIF